MDVVENICDLPRLGKEDMHIWGVHVPDMMDRLEVLKGVLCEKEREKADRFHREADRFSSVATRGALRVVLGGYTGIPAAEIEFCYTENGKPSLVPPASSRFPKGQGGRDACDTIAFNVSHSGEWAVLAVGRGRAIGVDIEEIQRNMEVHAVASRFFSTAEAAIIEHADDAHAAFFQIWSRKEAYVKACGSTLFSQLKSFSVPMENGAKKDGWYFHRLEAGTKYAAAVVTNRPVASVPCYDFGGLKWQS